MNRSTLLSQLQIDRAPEQGREPRRGFSWWIVAVLAGALILAALAWFLMTRPDRPLVRVVEAAASSSGSSARGGSLLDASG